MNLEMRRDPNNNPDLADGSAVDGHPGGGPGGFMPIEAMAMFGLMEGVKKGGVDKSGKTRGGGKKK